MHPSAGDRALHAPYVAMVRHLVSGMDDPGAIEQHQQEVEALLAKIIARIERIDPVEADAARSQPAPRWPAGRALIANTTYVFASGSPYMRHAPRFYHP
ncbi:hypothetical protein E2976_01935 (plasmid) [Paracoccus yeei]